MAMALVAPPVAGALSTISASDWSSTAAISEKSVASSRSRSASSSQVLIGESKATWSLVQAQGSKLSLFVVDILVAVFIIGVSHFIYSTFCYSRLQTIDKTRKRGFVCMALYQGAYFLIRDDPNSQRGVLPSVFIAAAGFTYKTASRGAARFDFGLFYAVVGVVVGIFIDFILLAGIAWMRLNFPGTTWDALLLPCITLAFMLLEIGANCFRVNMRFRGEDEVEDDNGGLPYYHNRPIRGRLASGKFWPYRSPRPDFNVQPPHPDEFLQLVNHALELNELPEQPTNPWLY